MYKLILLIMLCMWTAGSDAHKKGMQGWHNKTSVPASPEVLDFLNPFYQFSH